VADGSEKDMHTDLTFFTNEPDSTLLDRFRATLKNNTKFFDVLVGYFRTSGFFYLYQSLEKVEKIRILVGINANKQTQELIEQAKSKQFTLKLSHKETGDVFADEVTKEMEQSEDSVNVEQGVQKFIEFIKSGKLEIRAYPSQNIHAKVYIIRKDIAKSEDYGRVITGSSNFSYSGLHENLEFNVELKDSRDVKYALEKFEELWKVSVDISEKYVETINQRTWLNDTITPHELYLKFLYEYFREKINEDQDAIYKDKRYLPEGFMELEYQDEAVKDALAKLGEHGGVFLADVVGLGKTYISALLAQQVEGHKLIICPPILKEYWQDTFRNFGVPGFEVESLGKLDRLIQKGTDKYRIVFIDEAHRFRNETNQTYDKLKQICWGKKVILVSATPLNNRPSDILSQIKLFQKGHNSTIPNVRDLDKFFGKLKKKQDAIHRKHIARYLKIVKENSHQIRENILKYIMVRRTRSEVLNYFKEDLNLRNLKFPDISKPKRVYYEFDDDLNETFSRTFDLIRTFHYSRYMPLLYLKHPDPEEKQELVAQENLGRFMKILLIKRLESSFYAFKMTLNRFIASYNDFLQMLDKGTVYLSKKHTGKIYEALESDDDEEIVKLVDEGKAKKYITKDFEDSFKKHLKEDLDVLLEIKNLWGSVTADPKIDKFKSILKRDNILKKNKLIIFTESRETAEYLDKNLRKYLGNQVLSYSSKASATVRDKIIENYDPMHKNPVNDVRVLVTTDILAEGVNMHRSNVVINYDIPWNPTKVLQRVGRVNRVGTKHDSIYVYNFFPTVESNNEIQLEEAAIAKIQAFHDTLGEDAQYLTEGEEVTSHELFNRLNSKKVLEEGGEEGGGSELKYLMEIRDIRDKNPKLYEKIKRLPKKSRSAKLYKNKAESTITFFRKGQLRKIFLADNKSASELDFIKAAEVIKSTQKDKREKITPDFYKYLIKNKEEFKLATTEEAREFKQSGGRSNETILIRTLKAIEKTPTFTDEDEEYLTKVMKALKDGSLTKQTTKMLVKGTKGETNPLKLLYKIRQGIPESFLAETAAGSTCHSSSPREVILSELLIPKK